MAELAVRIAARRGAAALDIAFTAPLAGTTVLFGPSGAGKSSVLGAVAGLWRPEHATIRLGETVLQDGAAFVPPERRGFGLVLQDALLFPHLSVAGNLRYGARRAIRRADVGIDLDGVVALLGIAPLLERRPETLSGGERQRVAIGRALLARPRMLLMDEPLASLDGERRVEIIACLARLRAASGVPILYVTHATDEVARLADTLVLIEAGRVRAAGQAAAVAAEVRLPLAGRDDAAALLEGTVVREEAARGLCAIDVGGSELLVPLVAGEAGRRVRLRIAAREVTLARARPEAVSANNVLAVRVVAVGGAGVQEAVVRLALPPPGGQALIARVTRDAVQRLDLEGGGDAFALVKSTSIELVQGRGS